MPDLSRTSRRLILHDRVEGADIQELAQRAGWTFLGDIDRDPERGVFYEAKWDIGNGGSAHYIVDEFADVPYMVVVHEDPSVTDETLATIEQSLAVWTVDEMLEDCYVNVWPAGWVKALLRVGAGAPLSAVPEIVEHIEFSAEHKYAEVRRAAVWAMTYTAWPEFQGCLTRLSGTDEDEEVAREAGLALEQLAESGVIEL
ncbi:hypothetical protein [Streptomyces lanatus]|uniref:HEAT repeat domain-containing protein n=1 Tax=Streptomyces lanatus TaxID=66900 RepID=A0ABV1XTX9_9ACTN|nr:hypothetical protein [Streptomyces lanatus]GHH10965.1 hypothetical protein GCM10018780_48070 [Streptomyces lanatus]